MAEFQAMIVPFLVAIFAVLVTSSLQWNLRV